MTVNVQFTAITAAIELLGNITFAIHLIYNKGPSFSSFVHVLFTYLIILPCVFLMNTPKNKNMIIENGWRNTIRNIIGIQSSNDSNNENASSSKIAVRYQRDLTGNQCNETEQDSDNDLVISTIFRNAPLSNIPQTVSPLNVPFHENMPTTDGEMTRITKRNNRLSLESNLAKNNYPNNIIAKNIISLMIQNIKNEERYTKCFENFLVFLDNSGIGKDISKCKLEKNLMSYNQYHTCKNRKSRGKGGNSKPHLIDIEDISEELFVNFSNDSCNVTRNSSKYNPTTKSLGDKTLMRLQLLDSLCSSYNENEANASLAEELINLEKSFIEERMNSR